jgi:peptidoglycan/xylan/chitin deacetylase (PgdA/CDA1 family)
LLLLVYVVVLFCGSYFIQWGFFLKSVCSVKTTENLIALSFDDGPDPVKTQYILDILKTNQTEAAFFCIGEKIIGNEELLDRMVHEGHIIGNHSFSHHFLFDLFSARKMLVEIKAMSQSVKIVTGFSPRFFRPPYGVTNPNLKKAIVQSGVVSVGWSLRSYDTVIRNEDRLLSKILDSLKPGAILLLHDTSDTMLAILPRSLREFKKQDLKRSVWIK